MKTGKATLSYVAALTLYGTIGWALFYIDLPTEVVVLCRGAIGVVFIVVLIAAMRKGFDSGGIRRNLPLLVASGLLLGLNWVCLFAAYRMTTVAIGSLCNYTAPIILIMVAPVLLHEPLSKRKLACCVVALAGMVLVSGVIEGGAEGVNAPGVAVGLAGALCFVAIVVLNKRMQPMGVYERAAMQLLFSTLAALPFVLVNNWGVDLHPDALSVALVVMLGVVHTGFAYCLYFYAFEKLSAQTIAVLGYIEPAVSVLVSALILHQPLSALGWLGAALIIGASAVSEVVE